MGLAIAVCFISAIVAAVVAILKNRNPIGWFCAGALLPLISFMFLAVAEKLPPPEY
jgi:hypothetical protein